MKKLVLLLSLFCSAIFTAAQSMPDRPRQCELPAARKAMLTIIDDWKTGYNNADPDKVAALYTEDATYLTQHFITGIVHGRSAIRAYVKKSTDARYKVDKIDLLSSDCSGDFAYGITRYESTNNGQKAVGVNVVVLKKLNDKWMIVAHEAAVPDAASAIQTLDLKAN